MVELHRGVENHELPWLRASALGLASLLALILDTALLLKIAYLSVVVIIPQTSIVALFNHASIISQRIRSSPND